MLTICTWLWGDKYSARDVNILHHGLRKHLQQPFRFFCITQPNLICRFDNLIERRDILDMHLTEVPGCLARLRMFDPEWQKTIDANERLVSIDLDSIVTRELDPVFDRPEPFVILKGANFSNPCPYNGSLFMVRAGEHREVWSEFTWDAIVKSTTFAYPNDQAWFHHKVPFAAGWKAGKESGVYGFKKPGWTSGDALPPDARLVVFPGWRSPSKFAHLPWIKEMWASV